MNDKWKWTVYSHLANHICRLDCAKFSEAQYICDIWNQKMVGYFEVIAIPQENAAAS